MCKGCKYNCTDFFIDHERSTFLSFPPPSPSSQHRRFRLTLSSTQTGVSPYLCRTLRPVCYSDVHSMDTPPLLHPRSHPPESKTLGTSEVPTTTRPEPLSEVRRGRSQDGPPGLDISRARVLVSRRKTLIGHYSVRYSSPLSSSLHTYPTDCGRDSVPFGVGYWVTQEGTP